MVTIVGPYQRIIGVSWPTSPEEPVPGEIRWVTGFNAFVSSGQVVIAPYMPARYIWHAPNGLTAYKWAKPYSDPTGPYVWVEQYTVTAPTIGGNAVSEATGEVNPAEYAVIIGLGTTPEDIAAGARISFGYENKAGLGYFGKDWSGTSCMMEAEKVSYNYDTYEYLREPYGTQAADFTVFHKVISGRRWVPDRFAFMGLATQDFYPYAPTPSLVWKDDGPA